MEWYFLRHGETQSNLQEIYAGRSKEGLTLIGRQQAREVAENLACMGIGAIYCSPLRRAIQTAEIIGDSLNIEPIVEECFTELKYGIWEGKSEDEIRITFPDQWEIWNTRPAELVIPGRETLQDLLNRVLRGIEKIEASSTGEAILVVTHVSNIRVVLLHTRQMDLNLYKTIHVPNCKIFEVEGL